MNSRFHLIKMASHVKYTCLVCYEEELTLNEMVTIHPCNHNSFCRKCINKVYVSHSYRKLSG